MNNFKTSFEQRLLQDGANDDLSPREILRRARDRSVREMSQSMNESKSRSPNSQRLQSFVDIETASPHQHRLSTSINQHDGSNILAGNHHNQNISILNGPVSGQKNIVAQSLTQVVTGAREFDMDHYRRGSGLNTGREYATVPYDNNSSVEAPLSSVRPPADSMKIRKISTNRSNKGRKSSREPRSASRDRSREASTGYTLKELEKREKSL